MAIVAFILIHVDVGYVDRVLAKIKDIENVVEAHSITGEYDIIAKISVNTLEDIKKVVAEKIHSIEGVRKTVTLLAI